MSTSDPTLPGQAEGVAAPHRPAQMSLTTRAFLAVGLTLGFYLVALCVAAVLLYLPYAQWTNTGRVNAHVAVFCVASALGILWSILPRPERFVPPGPRLEALTQPELFHVLRDVGAATGQRMPVLLSQSRGGSDGVGLVVQRSESRRLVFLRPRTSRT